MHIKLGFMYYEFKMCRWLEDATAVANGPGNALFASKHFLSKPHHTAASLISCS